MVDLETHGFLVLFFSKCGGWFPPALMVRSQVRGKALDADSLLPLLVYTLVHANVPRIHEAMNFVRNFGGTSGGGELAYYLTSM